MMSHETSPAEWGPRALFDLTGQLAVVTGGGRGIGRAIAEALAACGATVAVCGRSLPALEETVAAIGARGHNALALRMDVSSEQDVAQARESLRAQFEGIDILVNNAGIDPHYASFEKTSIADWNRIIDVNLNGVFRCCQLLGGTMLPRRRGAIINVSSIAGHVALKRQAPYCASKGGVEQLTKALAYDWAEFGIRVNAIAYGFIKTDLTAAMVGHEHIAPRLLSRIPLGRFGDIGEVAGAALFLASPAASYVTGHSLAVDGGWTAS